MSGSGSSDALPKKLIVTRDNSNSYNFTENSDFQSFEELQAFIDKYKIEGQGMYRMPSGIIVLIDIINGVEELCPDNNPSSRDGIHWTWYEPGDMEWRLDLTNQTLGYYSYDD